MCEKSQSDKDNIERSALKIRHSWSFNTSDIGLKFLKDRRDKILTGGKYSDRYKETFVHTVSAEKKLSAYERMRKISAPARTQYFPEEEKMSDKTSSSLTTKIVSKGNSNATNELNKAHNTLTSYKQFSDGKTPSPQLMKKRDVNIYTVSPSLPQKKNVALQQIIDQKKPIPVNLTFSDKDNTMGHLQQIETFINKLNRKEKEMENLKKFENLVKQAKSPPKSKMVPLVVEKSHEFLKSQEHILAPIKHSEEVEDLQGKHYNQQENKFQRNANGRKSLTTDTTDGNVKSKKTVPLDRTASDAQQREVKITPRKTKIANRSSTKVLFF